jgi:hypothetical protein
MIANKFDTGIIDLFTELGVKPVSATEKYHYTHVTRHGKEVTKWNVPLHQSGVFWEKYADFVSEKPYVYFNLEEKADEHNPLIIDLTIYMLKSSLEEEEDITPNEIISPQFYPIYVNLMQQALLDVLDIKTDISQIQIAVLFQSEDNLGNRFYDTYLNNDHDAPMVATTIRVYFPFARCDNNTQKAILKVLINKTRTSGIFSKLYFQPHPPCGNPNDILSLPGINETIPMYGSTRSLSEIPMHFNYIFGSKMTPSVPNGVEDAKGKKKSLDREENTYTIKDASTVFNPLQHEIFVRGIHPQEGDAITCENIEYYYPYIFSKGFERKITLRKEVALEVPVTPIKGIPGQMAPDNCDPSKLAHFMLSLLADSRFNTYCYWLDIGRALYSVTEGSDEGLNTWRDITAKRSTVFGIEDCTWTRYYKFSDTPITHKTLAYYARTDSPDHYKQWHASWIERTIQLAIVSRRDGPLAQALYRMYWLDFVCSNIKSNIWYAFRGNYWQQLDSAVDLSKKIDGEFKNIFERKQSTLSAELAELRGGEDDPVVQTQKVVINNQLKAIRDICMSLDGNAFKRSVIRQAADQFHDERFDVLADISGMSVHAAHKIVIELMDETKLASGKVLECQTLHRPGKPEDYITRFSTIPYVAGYSFEHPDVKAVLNWLSQIYAIGGLPAWISCLVPMADAKVEAIAPTLEAKQSLKERLGINDLSHFVLKIFASTLRGGTFDKYLIAMVGALGNNSKTTLMNVFRKVLGSYAVSSSPSMICIRNNSNSSSASPDLARLKGAKVNIFDEPSPTEKINSGKFKSISSSDPITARKLNENGGEFRNMSKPFMITNLMPEIPFGGPACMRRLLIIPHNSVWCDDAPEDPIEQFKQRKFKNNTHFDEAADELAPALFWLMIQYYPIYRKEGVHNKQVPAIVKRESDKYWQQNDNVLKFEREKIVEVPSSNGAGLDRTVRLPALELYEAFKTWFHTYFNAEQCPNETQIRHDFTIRWGETDENLNWYGRRIKTAGRNGGIPPPR